MRILEVFFVQAMLDDCLEIDLSYEDERGGQVRTKYGYRASDPYSPLTPVITQWLADHPEQEILPYVPPAEPTPEELRALMPALTPRQFRDALIDADIMPDQVTVAIAQIPDEKQRAKALNAWEYPIQFTRTDPLINQIGAMFSLTLEQIDTMWNAAAGA